MSNGVDRSEGGGAGQVFMNRGTSLRADFSSQVFAGLRTVAEDKVPGHGPEGSKTAGPNFKTGVPARAGRRVRFPSASATLQSWVPPFRDTRASGPFTGPEGPVQLPGERERR